jgi:hypothetical protein
MKKMLNPRKVGPRRAEMSARYGEETSILDWLERLVCSGASGRPAGSDHRRETSGRLRHLRQTGLAPQLQALKSGRNPWKFRTAV